MRCAPEGLERRQWEREKTTGRRRSMMKPIPSMKSVGRNTNDNKNEMVVDDGQGAMRWAIEGWASEARGEGEDGGRGKGAQQSLSPN
jgi:hypothetical protein